MSPKVTQPITPESLYRAEADKLVASIDFFRTLVPNSQSTESGHRGEEGRWCEALLAKYIKNLMPSRYEVCTGFIVNPAASHVSRQLDIIVYDRQQFAPILSYGDGAVIDYRSVVAAISVKRTLYPKDVRAELSALAEVGRICGASAPMPIYTALVGFQGNSKSTGPNNRKWVDSVSDKVVQYYKEYGRRRSLYGVSRAEVIDSIVTIDPGILLHTRTPRPPYGEPGKPMPKSARAVWISRTGYEPSDALFEVTRGLLLRVDPKAQDHALLQHEPKVFDNAGAATTLCQIDSMSKTLKRGWDSPL
ncbi:DUF6602 domain-containing protein [Micrococcus luteus]|uniref:DUF6602 domain-containing protein n=1 Tax=Micrococcus luteus TaxID=1270 RepID=UPI001CA63531|nr:DUF6602 domain-containing protein [Micrococcus luteus]MCC0766592.1 hypothetical protein [Micrococcus luteus]QZY84075.1 hypothetical protein K7G68_11080 [Micrococcus luteus]